MITTLPVPQPPNQGQRQTIFGVKPVLVDGENNVLTSTDGNLCIDHSWPGKCAPFTAIINAS